MPCNLKATLEVMKTHSKQSTSAIYRCLVTGVLHDVEDKTFGNKIIHDVFFLITKNKELKFFIKFRQLKR